MATAKPYAAGTKTASSESLDQIKALLKKRGADRFGMTESSNTIQVAFVIPASTDKDSIGGAEYPMNVRFTVFLPQPEQYAVQKNGSRPDTKRSPTEIKALIEKETDRLWRALALGIKGKLVMVEEGIETLEEAMYAHIVNPGTGRTVYEEISGQVRDQYRLIERGEQPRRAVFLLSATES